MAKQKVKMLVVCYDCFFFQAEDGIRDLTVTGVQTCALPISKRDTNDGYRGSGAARSRARRGGSAARRGPLELPSQGDPRHRSGVDVRGDGDPAQIGRASCRGRVEISGVAGSLKKKKR